MIRHGMTSAQRVVLLWLAERGKAGAFANTLTFHTRRSVLALVRRKLAVLARTGLNAGPVFRLTRKGAQLAPDIAWAHEELKAGRWPARVRPQSIHKRAPNE